MLNRCVDRLSSSYVLLVMLIVSAVDVEALGLLRFLLGLPDPPTPPVLMFGGWRPIPGPVVRARSRPPSPHRHFGRTSLPINSADRSNRNQFDRQRSRPPPIFRSPPPMRFRQSMLSPNNIGSVIPDEMSFRTNLPSPPSSRVNGLMAFRNRPANTKNNEISFDEDNRIRDPSTDKLAVFTRVNPSVLENAIFRFDKLVS